MTRGQIDLDPSLGINGQQGFAHTLGAAAASHGRDVETQHDILLFCWFLPHLGFTIVGRSR
jgi:hypothetical protein